MIAVLVGCGTLLRRQNGKVSDLTEMRTDIKYIKETVSKINPMEIKLAEVKLRQSRPTNESTIISIAERGEEMSKKQVPTSKKLLWWSVLLFMAVGQSPSRPYSCCGHGAAYLSHPGQRGLVTVTAGFYLEKSKKENTAGGIVHDTAMAQLKTNPDEETEQGG